jgi:cytochrome b subunit of formate dehydrogenase
MRGDTRGQSLGGWIAFVLIVLALLVTGIVIWQSAPDPSIGSSAPIVGTV